ncbi:MULTISPECIES: N-acyl amino acid synthase FeeM domain-containing protein [unclassified Saccharothrix]|uniref:N-acyl amino acid synthase FeeM domain-containing protein n=1 Tax=unclassified Saccharothrix TaxID=2593673 RepID=UPI00307E9F67
MTNTLTSPPEVETDLFDRHPDARYYVGVLALPGWTVRPREHEAALRLRADVYIDEQGFLPDDARHADGGERDADDARSAHFGVVERTGPGTGRVIATVRLILRERPGDTLPVERYFPEVFGGTPAVARSCEASRFISRHEDKRVQRTAFLVLLRAVAAWAAHHHYRRGYALVEEWLARHCRVLDVPYERLTAAKHIPDYATPNLVIALDPADLAVGSDGLGRHLDSLNFTPGRRGAAGPA